MLQGVAVISIFYVIEVAMFYLNLFPDNNVLLLVDIAIRIVMGTITLRLINRPKKPLFTAKISGKMWIMMIPVLIIVSLPLVKILYADVFAKQNVKPMIIIILQQFAVGYFEEAYARGLFMDGLIRYNTTTVKQRLYTVAISGIFFGMTHTLNIFFGENPLTQVPSCIVWGCMLAAIFMLTDNLLLVMMLHAISDITPRVSHGLFGWTTNPPVLSVIDRADDIIKFVVFPLVAIYICVKFDELRKSRVQEKKVEVDRKE